MAVFQQHHVTNSILDLLTRGTGRPVGDARIPAQGDFDEITPYCIVESVPGTIMSGSLRDDEDAELVYQVMSVGRSREQCEFMADAVRRTVLARSHVPGEHQVVLVPPDGWTVNGRLPQDGFSGGIIVEGTAPHLVFSFAERYLIRVTPATTD